MDTQGIERLIFGLKDSGLEPLGDGCTSRCEFHWITLHAQKDAISTSMNIKYYTLYTV
jgi:hypothetical protein